MKKRLLSLLMIMAMVIALLPAIPAGAAEAAISWPSVGQPVTIGTGGNVSTLEAMRQEMMGGS